MAGAIIESMKYLGSKPSGRALTGDTTVDAAPLFRAVCFKQGLRSVVVYAYCKSLKKEIKRISIRLKIRKKIEIQNAQKKLLKMIDFNL